MADKDGENARLQASFYDIEYYLREIVPFEFNFIRHDGNVFVRLDKDASD
jgi:hypothetical protein